MRKLKRPTPRSIADFDDLESWERHLQEYEGEDQEWSRTIAHLENKMNKTVDAIANYYSRGRTELKSAARRQAINDVLKRCPTPKLRKVFQALLPKPPGAPRKQKAPLNKSEEKMLAALRLVNLHDAYMAEYPVSKEKQFLQWFLSSPLRGHLRTADAVRMKLKRAREIYGSVKVQTAGALRFLITNKI